MSTTTIDFPDFDKSDIRMYGDVNDQNVKDTISSILSYEDEYRNWKKMYAPTIEAYGFKSTGDRPKFRLYLTTFGGSAYDGLALYDTLKSRDVTCITNGYVMSAGILVMLGCKRRVAAVATEKKSWFIPADEALRLGLIDGITG